MGFDEQRWDGSPRSHSMDVRLAGWVRQVHGILKESGPLPLSSLARGVADATTNEVALAVGWLAHAGELRFGMRNGLWTVELARHVLHTGEADGSHGVED